MDGVLEPVGPETPLPIDQLSSDHAAFVNYEGIESQPAVLVILNAYIEHGWLKEFSTYEELVAFVGGEPILNMFACISKVKLGGSTKHRIIMDAKRSLATEVSRKQYRSVLPRQTDLVSNVLKLLAGTKAG